MCFKFDKLKNLISFYYTLQHVYEFYNNNKLFTTFYYNVIISQCSLTVFIKHYNENYIILKYILCSIHKKLIIIIIKEILLRFTPINNR